MRILYVTSLPIEYNFSNNIRNLGLIKGLKELGHTIDVCTYSPDKNSRKYDQTLDISVINKLYYLGEDLSMEDAPAQSLRGVGFYLKRLMRKVYTSIVPIDTKFFQVLKYSKKIKLEDDYSLMISSSDPKSSHILGRIIYKNNRSRIRKWIQYWGDPLVVDVNRDVILPDCIVGKIERNLYKYASGIVFTSPFTLDHQKAMYSDYAELMHFVPTSSMDFASDGCKMINDNELHIGYFGAFFSKDRNIFPLIEAIRGSNHHLLLLGSTDVEIKCDDNIEFNGRATRAVVERSVLESDVIVCLCNKSGFQIPGKIFHYAGSDKHILVIIDGENAEKILSFLRGYNRFICCTNDKNSIVNALSRLDDYNDLRKPCEALRPKTVADEFLHQIDMFEYK